MEESKKPTKDETYFKVLNCAVELEIRKGHLKWTMTELSRKSDVTRSLIYYYFGRSKLEIIEAAITIIGEEFAGLSEKRMKLWEEGRLQESLIEARALHDKAPHLCTYYINFRNKENDVGDALRKNEAKFLNKLRTFMPKASDAQINTIFAVYFGIVSAPNVGQEELVIFMQFMKDILGRLN
ncbi:MAG: TetR/AcrR family transcriptional regulator [Bdellovibrionales bacterium]|nr:TetR/AcrR family transcriptional regulator [Bdellovibrionales bacterium]NQZ18429.1 TetR/AcrR family transcriptional regulator [Bdellovibrionales bacterium]